MKYYFEKLEERILTYKSKYRNRPGKAAAKLAWWNLKCALKRHKRNVRKNVLQGIAEPDGEGLNIAFVLGGGIGDIILGSVYLSRFIGKLDCAYNAFLFVGQSVEAVKNLLGNYPFGKNVYAVSDLNETDFDLVLRLEVQFPDASFCRLEKIEKCSVFLADYIKKIEYFKKEYDLVGGGSRTFRQQAWCLLNGKTRITAMDVGGVLGISHEDRLDLSVPAAGYEILKKHDLEDRPFITLSRGVDAKNVSEESIKLWGVECYEELVSLLKDKYPGVLIVQLGVSEERCRLISGVDINLVGKTSFSELMALLGRAVLHVDAECGMVHLRHFLSRRPSVVLFGPTTPLTRGYSENINIRLDICPCPYCEWMLGEKWQTMCVRNGLLKSECMAAITPELVMERIEERSAIFLKAC